MPTVRYEQAVYGSFPFWHRGLRPAGALAGLPAGVAGRPSGRPASGTASRRAGDADAAAGALFALRLPDRGPWMVVGVCPQGADDHGRPGALAFHGLFVEPREFRKAGFDPFALAGAICAVAGDRRRRPCRPASMPDRTLPTLPAGDPAALAARIAQAIAQRRRVAIEADRPIDDLARAVWRALLPERQTAAGDGGDAGLRQRQPLRPSRAAPTARASNLTPRTTRPTPCPTPPISPIPFHCIGFDLRDTPSGRRCWCFSPWRRVIALALRDRGGEAEEGAGQALVNPGSRDANRRDGSPPDSDSAERNLPRPSDFRDDPAVDADQRMLVADGLLDLAARFGALEILGRDSDHDDREPDPTRLMVRLSESLRYRGPVLGAAELERLAREPGGERILSWHKHLEHFRTDRPLPRDFPSGPLRWQLSVLSWSFRVEPHPGLSPSEVPFALADALAAPWPVRPTPLANRYPALADYARFLSRLPRR